MNARDLDFPDHLDLIAAAPDGIAKLRGLILELAARGKLVPQDPNDEPASELLKRIAAEAAEIRTKAQFPVAENEQPFDVPANWAWVRFGSIAQHNSGKTLDKGRNSGQPRDYITTSNVYWGHFELGSVRQMLIRDDELEKCTARKNDLLICEGGEAGRAAVWENDKAICFQNHVHRARLFAGISPYFALRMFEKLNASGEINQYRKGVGISNMSSKSLASIPFPLPPLAEQHRIVAKVDELMALCDRLEAEEADAASAHARLVQTLLDTLTRSANADELAANWQRLSQHFDTLFTTEASLDALKQAILQLAVMGKLVPQDPNDEPASELLKRIAKERVQMEAEGTCKKSKPVPPMRGDEQPFSKPLKWVWTHFDEIINPTKPISYGVLVPGVDTAGGIPFVRLGDLSVDTPPKLPQKTIAPEVEAQYARTRLEGGEILMGVVGSIGKLGIAPASWKGANIARAVCRISPVSQIDKKFLLHVLKSTFMQKAFLGDTRTLAQPTLNIGLIRLAPTPIPPLAEQHRIVAKVDELMALCDRLKTDIAEARVRQSRLSATLIESALQAV